MDVSQDIIIDNINDALNYAKMPSVLKFAESGVCHGLAILRAKYVLEDKDERFQQLLELIANGAHKNPALSDEEKSELYSFAQQVLLAFQPQVFDKKKAQISGMEMLSINGKPLIPSFELALATTTFNWRQIFKEITLQKDEVMIVSSLYHTISIHRDKEGAYCVYDPNYSTGIKTFANEFLLISELRTNVFKNGSGNMGLTVQVIRHPEHAVDRKIQFPKTAEVYKKYVKKDNSTSTPTKTNEAAFSTLGQTAEIVHDKELIKELLELLSPDQKEYVFSLQSAIRANNAESLAVLLAWDKANLTVEEKTDLLLSALKKGKKEAFEVLVSHYFKKTFETHMATLAMIPAAATGANSVLLADAIKLFLDHDKEALKKHLIEEEAVEKSKVDLIVALEINNSLSDAYRKALPQAIESGSFACFSLLMTLLSSLKKIGQAKGPLSEEEKLEFFLDAVKNNSAGIVRGMIHEKFVTEAQLQSISMSTLAVKRCDLQVLDCLLAAKVPFSAEALSVIDNKRTEAWLGILAFLDLLFCYLQEYTEEKPQITFVTPLSTHGIFAKTPLQESIKSEVQLERANSLTGP